MKVGSIERLFPLNLIENRLGGYFINAAGEIFSTQLQSEPKKLLGNRGANGIRYYTLNRMSYGGPALLQRARAHSSFNTETAAPFSAVPTNTSLNDVLATRAGVSDSRHHATTVAEGIANRGVVLAMVKDGKLVFGSEPKIHVTEASFRSEMTRLAATSPGTKIVALKMIAAVEASALTWS